MEMLKMSENDYSLVQRNDIISTVDVDKIGD